MNNENNNQNRTVNTPQITPEQALSTIVSAVRQLRISYDEHVLLNNCLEVIKQNLSPPEKEDVPKNVVSI